MFWRSIPRAVDVLARPEAEDPPRAPPTRPPRPDAPTPSAPVADAYSSDEDDEDERYRQPPARPSRPPSRAGAMRRAVQAVIVDERRKAPDHMSDVVHAALHKERAEKEQRKGGLVAVLKKRKSVVDLFRKGAVRDRDEAAGEPSGRRGTTYAFPVASDGDESAGDAEQRRDRSHARSASRAALRRPSLPSSPEHVAPYEPRSGASDVPDDSTSPVTREPLAGAIRPLPYRSATSFAPPGEPARPVRRPSPARRMTATFDGRQAKFSPTGRDQMPREAPTRSRVDDVDPYQRLLRRTAYGRPYVGREYGDKVGSDTSSTVSATSRSASDSDSDAGSSYVAASSSTASFTLPRAHAGFVTSEPRPRGSARPIASMSLARPPRLPQLPAPRTEPQAAALPPETRAIQRSYTGLVNLGNTCYLACVVQAVVATDPLADFFANDDYLSEINTTSRFGLKGQLAKNYARTVRAMRGGEYRSLSPAHLRDTLGRLSDRFLEPTQQDAHELLLTLLDGLHEDLNLIADPPPVAPVSPQREEELERLPEVVAADQEWEKYRARNDSVIIDFFQRQMRNRMECMRCQQTSTTFSPLQTLSLSIPPPSTPGAAVSLSQCIEEFLREEILQGENAWHCPSCDGLRSTSKRFSVARLPQVLIIHLKRFTPLSQKLTTRVALPLEPLPLGHLLPPLALDSPYPLNAPHERETTYELYAACCHLGEDGSGHYTTLLRQPDVRDGSPPSFVLLDDETVDPLPTAAAQADALRKAETTAYLLFMELSRSGGGP